MSQLLLIQSETSKLVQLAIERMRTFAEEGNPYYLAFSGGKDSQTLYHLAVMAGVPFDAHYNITTVDPPELIHFVRRNYPDVHTEHPRYTMWQLIPKHRLPPTRLIRYCCRELKERYGKNRHLLTGIRWQESKRRSGRQMHERCNRVHSRIFLHPIIDWGEVNVWEFLKGEGIEYCSLYDEGFKRLGCIMCPMGGPAQMKREAERWPKFAQAYQRACDRAFIRLLEDPEKRKWMDWKCGADMYEWWLTGQKGKRHLVTPESQAEIMVDGSPEPQEIENLARLTEKGLCFEDQ